MNLQMRDVEKFLARVDRSAGREACWLWTGAKTALGYGQMYTREGKMVKAHRVALAVANDRAPELDVLHSCDNPTCVNPAHLREGTHQDNMNDKVSRSRQVRGVRQVKARLSPDIVVSIRSAHAAGESLSALARRHKVGISTVFGVVHRETWKHVA